MPLKLRISNLTITQSFPSVGFHITGYWGDTVKIEVKVPNGRIDTYNTVIYQPEYEDSLDGYADFSYGGTYPWLLGTYEVKVSLVSSNILTGFGNDIFVSSSFTVLTQQEFDTPILRNFPSSILQMKSFTWTITNAKPGEYLTYIENGPVTVTHSNIAMEADYEYSPPMGYNNISSTFEYAGDYILTFSFSRSRAITRNITVVPKVYIVFPETGTELVPFTYTMSGGDPNETWTFNTTGPAALYQTGTLDSSGNGSFTYTLPQSGSYEIIFTFAKSGKVKKQIVVLPNTRTGIHAAGTPIAYSEINTEFLAGYDLDQYRDRRWYLSLDNPEWDKNQGLGNFSTYDLSFYQFYSKRALDPVIPGTAYYGTPGYYQFTVPANRNGVRIQAWGGGGGSGSSRSGGATTVNFPYNSMYAGGGTGSGGGGRRYFSPGGGGGVAYGGQVNINGNGGGNDVGVYSHGGTGATAPNGGSGGARGSGGYGYHRGEDGQAPGGGGGGFCVMDTSKYPGYSGAGGGGSGAYSETLAVPIQRGTIIQISVGAGASDWASSGGNGAVRLSWS